MPKSLLIDLTNVDWKLLRTQKRAIVDIGYKPGTEKYKEAVEGLLCLIDHIQDEAEKQIGSKAVFG